jgi:hypothetical protein
LQRTSTPVKHPTADIWREAHKEAAALAEQARDSRDARGI